MADSDSGRPLVLFADDEVALHRLIEDFLATHGYHVDCVVNGAEAIRTFRRKRHDAVIIDLMMPEMNGYEFLRELGAIEPKAKERTIVVTGTSQETWEWFERDSVAAFLTKPVDMTRLLEELRKCVARAGS